MNPQAGPPQNSCPGEEQKRFHNNRPHLQNLSWPGRSVEPVYQTGSPRPPEPRPSLSIILAPPHYEHINTGAVSWTTMSPAHLESDSQRSLILAPPLSRAVSQTTRNPRPPNIRSSLVAFFSPRPPQKCWRGFQDNRVPTPHYSPQRRLGGFQDNRRSHRHASGSQALAGVPHSTQRCLSD